MYFRDFLFFLHNFCTDLSESVSHLLNTAFFAAAKNSFFLLYKKIPVPVLTDKLL